MLDANALQARQLALLSRDLGSLIKGSHEQLQTGDIVCKLQSPSVLGQLPDVNRTPLIEVSTSNLYNAEEQAGHFFLELNVDVKKVCVIHNCNSKGDCLFSLDQKRVTHCSTTLQSGSFYIITRSMGYPPRRS